MKQFFKAKVKQDSGMKEAEAIIIECGGTDTDVDAGAGTITFQAEPEDVQDMREGADVEWIVGLAAEAVA